MIKVCLIKSQETALAVINLQGLYYQRKNIGRYDIKLI